jgi:hypothetical protein
MSGVFRQHRKIEPLGAAIALPKAGFRPFTHCGDIVFARALRGVDGGLELPYAENLHDGAALVGQGNAQEGNKVSSTRNVYAGRHA